MQRAVSLTKQMSSTQLAQNREIEIEHLMDLLPHTLQTYLSIDLFTLIAKNRSRGWILPLPPTLIADSSGLTLLAANDRGIISVSKFSDERQAFQSFFAETRKHEHSRAAEFPKFIHKSSSSRPTFLFDFAAAEDLWRVFSPGEQRLQMYVVPATTQMTLLRAHWKQARRRAVYYIVVNKKSRTGRADTRLPFLVRKLPEFNSAKEPEPKPQSNPLYSVNIKSPSECWAVKRLKQIPEVNIALAEVSKILEGFFLPHKQPVKELICDFVPDRHKEWVLIGCKGCTFVSHARSLTEKLEQKHKIDLKFILFPLFNQKQILGQRIREAKKVEEPGLSSYARRISVLGLGDMKKEDGGIVNSPQRPLEACDTSDFRLAKGTAEAKRFSFNKVINDYDEMMGNIKRYKLELKGTTNFYERYGGGSFWDVVLAQLHGRLGEDGVLSKFFIHMNFEQSSMLQRSYQRILEGNYNMYYKQSLIRVHKNLGVTTKDFVCFLKIVEQLFSHTQVSPQDCSILVRRFRMLENCVCSRDDRT